MADWAEVSLALTAFLAAHIGPARLKTRLVGRVGRRGYVIAYSVLSLGLLIWLIAAAGRAPYLELWPQAGWMRWLVNLAMPLAFLLGATAGLGGVLSGFALWAGAHLIANGDLAHVLLFGVLLGYALLGLAARRAALVPKVTARRIALGLSLWAGTLLAHQALIGVSPLP